MEQSISKFRPVQVSKLFNNISTVEALVRQALGLMFNQILVLQLYATALSLVPAGIFQLFDDVLHSLVNRLYGSVEPAFLTRSFGLKLILETMEAE